MAQQDNHPIVPRGAAFYPAPDPGVTRNFAFFLQPEFTLLAFSSAVDPLRIANQLSQKPLFHWQVLSEDGKPVTSSSGVTVVVDGPLGEMSPDTTLIICAGNPTGAEASARTLSMINRHHRFGGRLGAICTGATTLARAGLLAGRAFTLHWENQPAFCERFPDLTPSANKFEIDGRVLTSGGGAAATDLMLALIERDLGRNFAAMVSDMCLRRVDIGADLPQRSALSAVAQTRNPGLIALVNLMKAHFEDPLDMEALAERAGYSRRHIERLFKTTLGESPARFYQNLRLDHGRSLLADTELSLFEIAAACGFESKAYFSRAFCKRFGEPPSRYHARSGRARRTAA